MRRSRAAWWPYGVVARVAKVHAGLKPADVRAALHELVEASLLETDAVEGVSSLMYRVVR
jgi:hypothetical protein